LLEAGLGSLGFSEVFEDIIKFKGSKYEPLVIFNTINGDSNVAFYRQLIEIQNESNPIPVMAVSLTEVGMPLVGMKYLRGHYFAGSYFQCLTDEEATPQTIKQSTRRFIDRFKQRYGSRRITDDPIEAAYSQVHMFAKAVEKAGSADDPLKIRDAALLLRYNAPGGPIKIDEDNQHCWRISRIAKVDKWRQDEPESLKIVYDSEDMMQPDPNPRPIS